MRYLTMSLCAVMVLTACGGESTTPEAGSPKPSPPSWVDDPSIAIASVRPDAQTLDWSCADPDLVYDERARVFRVYYSSGIEQRDTGSQRVVIRSATSPDGRTWIPVPGVVLDVGADPETWDHTHVETPSVAWVGNRWVMAYSGGNRDRDARIDGKGFAFPWYQIGFAESVDGVTFTKRTVDAPGLTGDVVLSGVPGLARGLAADPELAYRDGILHLWCSSFAEDGTGGPLAFGISAMRSSDGGRMWTRPGTNPLPSLIRPGTFSGGQQPSVVARADGGFDLWFTNDLPDEHAAVPTPYFTCAGVFRATSPNGLAWDCAYDRRDFTADPTRAASAYGLVTGSDVCRHDGMDHLVHAVWGSEAIPEARYVVPLADGSIVPAVMTLRRAVRPVATPRASH